MNPVLPAIVSGLVQVVKATGLNPRLLPLSAVILGVVISSVYSGVDVDSIIDGILLGLASVGLYEGIRSVASPR